MFRPLACLLVTVLLPLSTLAADKITFDDHAGPLLRDKCGGCHNSDKARGGFSLATYGELMEGGSSGAVVESGDPDASRLMLLITHQEEPFMPPKADKMPAAEIETIRGWIAGGALENASSKAKPKKKSALAMAASTGAPGKPDGPAAVPRGLRLQPQVRTERTTAISALAASPWAPVVAVAGQRQVLLYHTGTSELRGVLPFPEGVVESLRFSRDGEFLIGGGGRPAKSGKVVVWNVRTGERMLEVGAEFDAVLTADMSVDRSLIALGSSGKVVRVYSTDDGSLAYEIRKHTDWIYAVEFSPDGVLLATADRNGGLFVWEAATGREYLALRGHGGAVTDVAWRADSNILASASEDGSVFWWEMEDGRQVKRWRAHGGGVLSVDYGRDGRSVTAGRDKTVKVWKADGAGERTIGGFADLPLEVVFDTSAQKVIVGDWTGAVGLFASADGKKLTALPVNPPLLEDRLAAAEKQLAAIRPRHDELVAALAVTEAGLAGARADLERSRQEVATAKSEASESGKAAEAAKVASVAAGEALDQRVKELAGNGDPDAGGKGKEAVDLATRAAESLKAWQAAHAQSTAAQSRVGEASRRVAELEPRVKELETVLAKQKTELEPLARDRRIAEQQVERWRRALALEAAFVVLVEKRQALVAAEDVVAEGEAAVEELDGQIDALREKLRELRDAKREREDEVETKEATRAAAQKIADEERARVEAASAALAELQPES